MPESTVTVKISPMADQVVVRPASSTEQTPGGLFIPTTAQEKKCEGTVLEVGPGRIAPMTGTLIVPRVQKGDRVIYSKYAGTEIKVNEEDVLVIREDDVLVKIEEVE